MYFVPVKKMLCVAQSYFYLLRTMHLYLAIFIFTELKLTIEAVLNETTQDYCLVRQAKFSYTFDFSELTNKNQDYIVRHKEYNFLKLQLCQPLKNKCNDLNDIAVCYYNGHEQFAIGREPPQVVSEFGQTIFKYTGEKCKTNRNYTVNIEMICDFSAKETNQIKWFPSDDGDCKFNLQWRTVSACAQKKQIKCSLHHKTERYDLSSLINYSDNYEVFISNKYLAILNICHSVLYRPNSCQSNNAACLVSSENQGDSKNLGIPTEDLKYNSIDKSLSLTYTDGAICAYRNVSINHIQTTITFFCNLNVTKTLPEYVGGMEKCHYQFKWITAAACSEEALKNKTLQSSNNETCLVRNPLNNYVYNLSSLMNRQFSSHRFGVKEYYNFSICNPLLNTVCETNSGVCQINRNISGGLANPNLMWKESGPYLNYTSGSLCGLNRRQYTVVEFYCGEHEDYEIEETGDPCYNKIKMSTNLTCEKSIYSCVTYNKDVNLEPLKLELSNYVIKSDNLEYRINVCNPLVREEGLNCPDGTAICKFTYGRNDSIKAISLGYPSENLVRNSDRSAVLIYRNGSSCEENQKRTIESSISFLCDINNGNGMPNLKLYKDCTFFFVWPTELVCGLVIGKFHEQNCSITNGLGDTRDLSFLQEFMGSQYVTNSRRIYNVSLCGRKCCGKGFICTNELNYGTDVTVFYDYSINLIRIDLNQGTKCEHESNAKSSITLICREENLSTKPIVIKEDSCNIEFEWHTSKICQKPYSIADKNIKQPIIPRNNYTKSNIISSQNKFKQNDNSNKGKNKLLRSNGLNGVQIIGIIFAIAFVVAALIYIAKRWIPSYNGFSIFT